LKKYVFPRVLGFPFFPSEIPQADGDHDQTGQEFRLVIEGIGDIRAGWKEPAKKGAKLIQNKVTAETAGKIGSAQSRQITQGVAEGLSCRQQEEKDYDL
jgi:hypothetical protein